MATSGSLPERHAARAVAARGRRVEGRLRGRKTGFWPVRGRFGCPSGDLDLASPAKAVGTVTVAAPSISTRMPPRDARLRSRDFLDAERHPEIRVEAEQVEPVDERTARVHATLEVWGNSQPVELTDTILDVPAPGEEGRLRLRLAGTLDRHDLGVCPHQPVKGSLVSMCASTSSSPPSAWRGRTVRQACAHACLKGA